MIKYFNNNNNKNQKEKVLSLARDLYNDGEINKLQSENTYYNKFIKNI